MTSKVAKCERIFSNGEDTIKLEIDYQNKRYNLSPVGDDLGWGFKFLWRKVDCVKDDYALLDLMRQAIEFAEGELKEKGEEIEEDKPQEPLKVKRKREATMYDLREQGFVSRGYYSNAIPDSAKVTIEWTEEEE